MRAELKSVMSTDTGVDPVHPGYLPDINEWKPKDARDFGILISATIGAEGHEGADLFYFMVCTPHWLEREIPGDNLPWHDFGYMFGRHHFIVAEWDYDRVYRMLQDLCKQTEAADWSAIGQKLPRYGQWEFEDYRRVDLRDV